MSQTLLIGATGLLAYQQKLDVVANNIANSNTTSYKSQRALFSDLLYDTRQPALGSRSEIVGGTNPEQIGHGVRIAEISKNFSQGVLENTGQDFDFAIQGDGFFVVSGQEQSYTRDGSFAIDGSGYLVDPATGGFIQRFGTNGEGSDTELSFQTSGDNRIRIPLGENVPGNPTSEASFDGNLPVTATPPEFEVLTTSRPFVVAGTAATATTLLNDLDTNTVDYGAGDVIEVTGSNSDGSPFSASVAVTATSTLGDLVAAIDSSITGGTATLLPDGNIRITADAVGESFLSVNLQDASGNTGSTDFISRALILTTNGKEGDTVESTIQVFDIRGQSHSLQVSFEKKTDNQWDATFTSSGDVIDLPDGQVTSIIFNEDGSFQTVNGTGLGNNSIDLQIDSISSNQRIVIDLSDMTHLAAGYSATFDQNGLPPGSITNINVTQEGILSGVTTNGTEVQIAQLAIASFANNHALENVGDNYYIQTSNSGNPTIGPALAAGTGSVVGGQLETSNVDIALEFTQLIIAQRGFSANARTISVATEVLQELNSIFR